VFIVIEGVDGCGKGTQAAKLADRLHARLVKYPNRSTPIGKLIDRWLRDEVCLGENARNETVAAGKLDDALALQTALLANKIECQSQIMNAIKKNGRVVADRYWPSAVAYGTADGLSSTWLRESHSTLIQPDLIILLDIPLDTSIARIAARKASGQADNADTYGAVRNRLEHAITNYHSLANDEDWALIDGTKSIEQVFIQILRTLWDRGFEV
jgi:dTMP kinase